MRVLLVDDDLEMLNGLAEVIRMMGFTPVLAASGQAALAAINEAPPALMLLDLLLPDGSGFELVARLKAVANFRQVPVIVLSGVDNVESKLEGFGLGIEDYVCKPFDVRELMARINVVVNRRGSSVRPALGPDVTYNDVDKTLTIGSESVMLTLNEDRLFRALLAQPNQAVSKAELFQAVWKGRRVGQRNLDTLVTYLRKKLGRCGLEIKTVHGMGYEMRLPMWHDALPPPAANASWEQR